MTFRAVFCLVALIAVSPGDGVRAQDAHHHGAMAASDEAPFLAENRAAMEKMMTDMAAPPTGDVDTDFTAMMIPHHQGAIDMAVAYLRVGTNPQLRRLAQEIIVDQTQEIAAMRLAIGAPLPPPAAAPTETTAAPAGAAQ